MKPKILTMEDAVTVGNLGINDDAYAGYVGGYWENMEKIRQKFPGHYFLSIANAPDQEAECCDCEAGDFTVTQVLPWLREMHAKGVWRPCVYAGADTLNGEILPVLARNLPRSLYRVWGALYNGVADIPDGWDGHQYETNGVDKSVVKWDFFQHTKARSVRANRPRIWKAPVTATVQFDPRTGDWEAHGA